LKATDRGKGKEKEISVVNMFKMGKAFSIIIERGKVGETSRGRGIWLGQARGKEYRPGGAANSVLNKGRAEGGEA